MFSRYHRQLEEKSAYGDDDTTYRVMIASHKQDQQAPRGARSALLLLGGNAAIPVGVTINYLS